MFLPRNIKVKPNTLWTVCDWFTYIGTSLLDLTGRLLYGSSEIEFSRYLA